jgi:cathepsin L
MASIEIAPTSIAIEADKLVFQFYTSGVLNSAKCGTNLDHGVLAVGYGTDSTGQAYYLVKNSWNTSWGDNGYIKIANIGNGDGICGIQMDPVRAVTN